MAKETLLIKLIKLFTTLSAIPGSIIAAPISKLYDFIAYSRHFAGRNSPANHLRKVRKVQAQVKKWNADGRKKRMCTGRKAWQKFSLHNIQKSKYTQIKIDLDDVVEIDTDKKVLTVEPGMMMGKLSSILLPLGWTIPVIPELDTLTIGGIICGTGIETSSNKYGLSSEINLAYEVVLANGELVHCSKDENSDLFYSIPWSHGTIGFLTAVDIPLIPAKKYVKYQYFPTSSVQDAKRLLLTSGHDFVEGIMYGPNKIVVMIGDMVNEEPSGRIRVNRINRWFKPWFFKHVESFLAKNPQDEHIELIPLRDYYHRHTRAFFWEAKYLLPFGNNRLIRGLFDWIYPFNFKLMKLFIPLKFWEAFYVTNHVIQDFIVPMEKLEASLEFVHQHVEVYPLWLCPCKFFNHPGMAHSSGSAPEELYIDIGIYGDTPKTEEFEPETSIGEIEQFAIRNNGVQFLYADSFMTKEDFRKMFDMTLYDQVREKYECNAAFPDVYDKVSKYARSLTTPTTI